MRGHAELEATDTDDHDLPGAPGQGLRPRFQGGGARRRGLRRHQEDQPRQDHRHRGHDHHHPAEVRPGLPQDGEGGRVLLPAHRRYHRPRQAQEGAGQHLVGRREVLRPPAQVHVQGAPGRQHRRGGEDHQGVLRPLLLGHQPGGTGPPVRPEGQGPDAGDALHRHYGTDDRHRRLSQRRQEPAGGEDLHRPSRPSPPTRSPPREWSSAT